jgi:glucose dehydrogenase
LVALSRPRLVWVVLATIAPLLAVVAPATAATGACGSPTAPDEWPTFGRDLANSRAQQHAGDISPTTTPTLQPVWSFSTGAAFGGFSDLNGTPIVSGGCVFLNSAGGDVVALDASDGTVVWRHHVALDPGTVAGLGGTFVSSPTVTDDAVLALVNQAGAP